MIVAQGTLESRSHEKLAGVPVVYWLPFSCQGALLKVGLYQPLTEDAVRSNVPDWNQDVLL